VDIHILYSKKVTVYVFKDASIAQEKKGINRI
jgi:hypothetical protein